MSPSPKISPTRRDLPVRGENSLYAVKHNTMKSNTIEQMKLMARMRFWVDTIAQPWPGIQTALSRTPDKVSLSVEGKCIYLPWSNRDQCPRITSTRNITSHLFCDQTAILATIDHIIQSVKLATHVRNERLMLARPTEAFPRTCIEYQLLYG